MKDFVANVALFFIVTIQRTFIALKCNMKLIFTSVWLTLNHFEQKNEKPVGSSSSFEQGA